MQGTGRAWYFVGILVVLYAFSCIDRYILALLVQPISAEFELSDSIQGLMLGAGFAVVYSLTGLPLAHLIDRGDRRLIVAIGAILWGATTVASGFAPNVETLVICRTGVAIGEAVLSPAAVSLISDLFPREKRSLPVSMYVGTSQLMSVGSFVVSGAALDLATHLSPDLHTAPWRLTMMLVGLPSILVALLILATVKEPPRKSELKESSDDSSLPAFLAHFRERIGLYGPTFLGVGCGAMLGYGLVAWLPTLMVRTFDVSAQQAGYYLGIVGLAGGLSGAFGWPWIAKRFGKHDPITALMGCLIAAAAIGYVMAIIAANMTNMVLFLAFFTACFMAIAAYAPIVPILIQTVAPGRMHARLISISFLCSNLIGFAIGPLLVPQFAKFWPDPQAALGAGVATLAAVIAPVVITCFAVGLRAAKAIKRREAQAQAAPFAPAPEGGAV
ncbi:MAG: MFS transporter [Hyphomonadaceae bacterium]